MLSGGLFLFWFFVQEFVGTIILGCLARHRSRSVFGLPIFVSAGFSETVWAFDFCAIGSGGAL